MSQPGYLDFDFSYLHPDQAFTLHAGSRQYALTPHTARSRELSRRTNGVLRLVPDSHVTHYAQDVRLPPASTALLRVTAPTLRPGDPLDRLVWTGIYVPRASRAAGIARRREQGLEAGVVPPKLAALGDVEVSKLPISDEDLGDLANFATAYDAAASLIFHHPEMMALHPTPAERILDIIHSAAGMNALAASLQEQARNHEADPTSPNWVESRPGTDWKTGQPSGPIYVWSDETLEWLGMPLRDSLVRTKDAADLEGQCWTVQRGITEVPATSRAQSPGTEAFVPAGAIYTLKQLTPQAGIEATFDYDNFSKSGVVHLTNYYLRWLQVSVDQYNPNGAPIASTTVIGRKSPVDTIMAIPLPAYPEDFSFPFMEEACRATLSFGGLGQAPFQKTYDSDGVVLTSIFNLAVPTLFMCLGVAVDEVGGWTSLQKRVVGEINSLIESAAQGPFAGAIANNDPSFGLEQLLAMVGNMAATLLISVLTSSEALTFYLSAALSQSTLEKAQPFIGWIAQGLGAAIDLASIIETSVDVGESPGTMGVDIVRTMDLQVTAQPDPRDPDHFPATATHYDIMITYDSGPVYTFSSQLAAITQPPIVHAFEALPAGGFLNVQACFYSDTGWLAGKGQSRTMPGMPNEGSTLVAAPLEIVENLVPLTATTTYSFKQKLAYRNGQRVWATLPEATAPTETVTDLDRPNTGNVLAQPASLGLNEPLSAVGYLWQAAGQGTPLEGKTEPYNGQMFTYQNINDGAAPQSGLKYSRYGYIAMPLLAYPPPTAVNAAADGFLLEPDDTSAHSPYLRALSLQAGQPFLASPGTSFGRFIGPQDDLTIHPSGFAVGLNSATSKL